MLTICHRLGIVAVAKDRNPEVLTSNVSLEALEMGHLALRRVEEVERQARL